MPPSSSSGVVRRFVVVALAIPAAMVVVALVLQSAWLRDLPDPAATHWGPGGTPDGFGSGWTFIVITAVLGLGLPALVAATTLPMLRRGARGFAFRFMAAFALGMATFIAILNTSAVAAQRGLEDAVNAPHILSAMLVSFGSGIGAGVVGWYLQPAQSAATPEWDTSRRIDLAPGERVVWMRTATMARWGVLLLLAVGVAVAGATAATWITGAYAATWILAASLAVLALAAAMATVFHVRIDGDGLTAVSALGFPRVRVSLNEVAETGVAPVNGFAEFGGWGYRVKPGAVGIVLRNGDALQVTRKDGRRVVVTVDDAHTAAGLLQALAGRSPSRKEG